jgi:hypothetical protein
VVIAVIIGIICIKIGGKLRLPACHFKHQGEQRWILS